MAAGSPTIASASQADIREDRTELVGTCLFLFMEAEIPQNASTFTSLLELGYLNETPAREIRKCSFCSIWLKVKVLLLWTKRRVDLGRN